MNATTELKNKKKNIEYFGFNEFWMWIKIFKMKFQLYIISKTIMKSSVNIQYNN